MAELITTDEEKEKFSYLEWDNESIGKAVKETAISIEDYEGGETVSYFAACLVFISEMIESDKEYINISLSDVEMDGKPLGDWNVVVERE